ncbi:MAG: GFA family protein [Pseudomonadota bacterium]
MAERTGKCLCGAVRFSARNVPDDYVVCHCQSCRRWLGSALFGVSIPKTDVVWEGAEAVAEIQSSTWAKRAWCTRCGTGLYFQFTAEGTYSDEVEIPLGLFDDPNGFRLKAEIYVDQQPDSFALQAEGHRRLTRADCIEKMPILGSES